MPSLARTERTVLYALVAMMGVAAAGATWTARASASRAVSEPPEPSRVAMCDIYDITDKLMNSERYQPQVVEAEEKVRTTLEPLETELRGMQERLSAADPSDQAAQALFQEYQRKGQQYQQIRAQLELERDQTIARLYLEAYDAARASARAVAEDLGYTHVIASRGKDEIETADPREVLRAILARPVIHVPEDADLTADVIADLKLE